MAKPPDNIGAPPTYHPEFFEDVLLKLFKNNGRLNKADPLWNSAGKAVKALAEAYQEKYPKDRVPGETWRKNFVRSFLDARPEYDLIEPRRRRPRAQK